MKCNKNARWVIKNIIVDPHFGARFHALSCNLFCQVSQPQEATWRLLIGCYGIRYCFLKSYQEATPGGGYAGGVQSLLEGEVAVFLQGGSWVRPLVSCLEIFWEEVFFAFGARPLEILGGGDWFWRGFPLERQREFSRGEQEEEIFWVEPLS